jgi:sulfur transfer complex TusBCD TusB component (DsrH family)
MKRTSSQSDFISTKTAAEIIGCTEGRVRVLAQEGILDGFKLNERAWSIRRDSAEKYAKKPQKTGRPRLHA